MKIITVKVIPNARKNEVIPENGRFRVKVAAPAADGKANKAVIKALADHFKVKERKITIIKGEKSREKQVQIL
ncbi:MAG: YggU family protein [Sinomicrobium sp.]|nr:YggU family protein [Sinomicrobium sp.]